MKIYTIHHSRQSPEIGATTDFDKVESMIRAYLDSPYAVGGYYIDVYVCDDGVIGESYVMALWNHNSETLNLTHYGMRLLSELG